MSPTRYTGRIAPAAAEAYRIRDLVRLGKAPIMPVSEHLESCSRSPKSLNLRPPLNPEPNALLKILNSEPQTLLKSQPQSQSWKGPDSDVLPTDRILVRGLPRSFGVLGFVGLNLGDVVSIQREPSECVFGVLLLGRQYMITPLLSFPGVWGFRVQAVELSKLTWTLKDLPF